MLLFLGAGASRTFGIPDTKGFISEFEQAIGGNRIYEMLKSSVSTLDTEALMTILHDLSKPKEELLRSIAPHTARFLLERPSGVAAFIEDDDVKTTCQDLLKQVMGIMRTKCLDQVRKEKQRILDSYDTFFRSIHEQGKERGATMHYGPIKANDGSGMEYPPMAIFTTNYDTCIESYFKARQIRL